MQIDQLIVFAGPTCGGKTTLIEGLYRGNCSSLLNDLNINHPSTWITVNAGKLDKLRETKIDLLMFHYDIIYRFKSNKKFESDKTLDIIETSNNYKILTLWTPSETLISRLKLRKIQVMNKWFNSANIFREYRLLRKWCRLGRLINQLQSTPNGLALFYIKWLEFCQRYDDNSHWFLNTLEDKPTLRPINDWYHTSV